MKKSLFAKVLSVLLCVGLAMTTNSIVPWIASQIASAAAAGEENTKGTDAGDRNVYNAPTNEKWSADNASYTELVDKRELSTKYFQLDNGKFEAVKYGSPVHYLENGKLKDIDNTLLEYTDKTGKKGFTNRANDFQVELFETVEDYLASISKGQYRLSWFVEGMAKGATVSASTYLSKDHWNGLSKGDQRRNLPGIASKAEYKDAIGGADLELVLLSDTLKQHIILKEFNGITEYNEKIHTEGLELIQNADGSIVAVDEKDHKAEVFYFKTAFVEDSKGNYIEVKVSLEQVGDYDYALTYAIDEAWLQKATYPVLIDPSITTSLNNSDINDTRLAEGLPSTNYCNSYIMCTGYGSTSHTNYSLVKFLNLPTLSQADMIIHAGYRDELVNSYSSPSTITVHNVTSDWNVSSVTWNTKPTFNSSVEDYRSVGTTAGVTTEWDITHIAKQWYTGGANYGILLKDMYSGTSTSYYKEWRTSNATYGTPPYAYFVYVNDSGLEGYWDYATSTIGRGGRASVNLYNGNLVYSHNDLSMSGNRMPVTVTHTFNSNTRNDGQWIILCGSGWMTNYDQYLTYQVINETPYYTYVDEDGTRHYFKNYSGTYKDESGLDSTLSWTGTRWELKDKNDNKICFDSNGVLICIIDRNGNQQTVNRNASDQITSITDGAGRSIVFERNGDGTLYRIKDPANRYVATYTYTGIRLTRITYADGNHSDFTYDANGNMQTATNIDGKRVTITYNAASPYRISRIEESNGSTLGARLDFAYGLNRTEITDVQGRTVQYQFNDSGNTVCIVGPDGSAQYTSFGKNINGATSNDVNKLTSVSKTQKFTKNFLLNHNMEADSVWDLDSRCGSSGTHVYDTSQKYLGNRSIKLSKTNDPNGWESAIQVLNLERGKTYTVSGYQKTDNVSYVSYCCISFATSPTTSAIINSKPVSGTTDWERNFVTFTLPSDAYSTTVYVQLLLSGADGTAWFDCWQAEEGYVANRYNLAENADMDYSYNGIPAFWNGSNLGAQDTADASSDTTNPSFMSDNRFKMIGDCIPANWKGLTQNIMVSGNVGDSFVIGGWSKGNSVPIAGSNNTRQMLISLMFHYTDGSVEYNDVYFNEDSSVWQYCSGPAVANKAYDYIIIHIMYTGNANTAWFDGINVYKEMFGNSFSYDANGNLVSATDAAKQNEQFQYTNNDLTKYIDPAGKEFTFSYDSHHNMLTATSQAGLVYTYTYDSYGNATSSKVGNTTNYIKSTVTNDANGNYTDYATDPFGKQVNYSYDTYKGILTDVTDPLGNVLLNTYDNNTDYLTATSMTSNGVTMSNSYAYIYDRLEEVSHNAPNGGTVAYDLLHNALGWSTGTNVGLQSIVSYSLQDRTGRLNSVTYGNGQVIEYTYDAYDRLKKVSQSSTDLYLYEYDSCGNIGYIKDNVQNVEYWYEYDSLNRLGKTTTKDAAGVVSTSQMSYNNKNKVAAFKENVNGTNYETGYTYDDDGRATTSTFGTFSKNNAYDTVLGRVASYSIKNGTNTIYTTTLGYANGDGTTSTASGRIESVNNGGETLTYSYDDRGFITQVYKDANNYSQYRYDAFGQLIRENYKWGATSYTKLFAYDVGGNITSQTQYAFVAGGGAVGTPVDTVAYTYDGTWKDKLASFDGNAITYDAIGNPLTYNGWTYTWTHGRKLQQVSNGSTTASYKYDASGIRTEKTVNGTTTKYNVAGGRITWQKTGTNNPIYFLYDAAGKLWGLKYSDGNVYFYVRNAQGDVIKLVNSSGTVVVEYAYDAWGNPMGTTGSMAGTLGADNPFRYRGYYFDTETGLYYLQSRYYNPQWGRFVNADDTDVLEAGDGIIGHNLFAYCVNDPINKIDESGYWFGSFLKNLFVAAVVVFVVAAAVAIVAPVLATSVGITIASSTVSAAAVTANVALGGAGAVASAELARTSGISLAETRSSKRPAKRSKTNSRKSAKDQAQHDPEGDGTVRHNPNGHQGDRRPHYHPGGKSHNHYYYPR